jgi:hypothetical protein
MKGRPRALPILRESDPCQANPMACQPETKLVQGIMGQQLNGLAAGSRWVQDAAEFTCTKSSVSLSEPNRPMSISAQLGPPGG